MKSNLNIYFLALALLGAGSVCAQQSSIDADTVKNKVFVPVDYIPTLSEAFKISELPTVMDSVPPKPTPDYAVVGRQLPTVYEIDTIKAAKIKGEPLNELYRSYVKVGAGNYKTSMADVYLNTVRSRTQALGVRLKHRASSGELDGVGQNAFSNNAIGVYGRRFLRKHTVSGNLDGSRDVVHYYGYNPSDFQDFSESSTEQVYWKWGGQAAIKSFYKDSAQLNHNVNVGYYNLVDGDDTREQRVTVDGQLTRFFNNEQFILDAGYDFNSVSYPLTNLYGDFLDDNLENNIVKIAPQVVSRGDKWRLAAGMKAFGQTNFDGTTFHFYPNAYFKYNLIKDIIIPYVGVTGGLERNTLDQFRQENPFISGRSVFLRTSNTLYDVYGGFRGAFSSKISFNLQFSRSRIEDMPMYVNPRLPGTNPLVANNKFRVLYDTVEVINLNAETSYQMTEKVKLLLRGDYYSYNTETEFAAWHRPDFAITASGMYDLRDKVVLRADIFGISSQLAKSYDPNEGDEAYGNGVYGKRLKGVIDINLSAEYRYTKQLSAFIQLNNIAAMRYNRWNNYPTQGFNALGGLSYKFWKE